MSIFSDKVVLLSIFVSEFKKFSIIYKHASIPISNKKSVWKVLWGILEKYHTPNVVLINEVKKNHQAITHAEINTALPPYSLTTFLRDMCANPHAKWFEWLYELMKIMYEKSRKLVKIFYKSLPILATKYIQIHHIKLEGKN